MKRLIVLSARITFLFSVVFTLTACALLPSENLSESDTVVFPPGNLENTEVDNTVVDPVIEDAHSAESGIDTDLNSENAEPVNDVVNVYNDEPADLWQRIRNDFSLSEFQDKRIQQQLDWYVRHPAYMERVAERARPYLHYIVEEIDAENIPMEFALLPIVESAFQPFAYSHGRASGIWQFIPSTGRLYGLRQNWWYDGRRDVYAATKAAVKLLSNLTKQFNGDALLALAAYNSGAGTVQRAINNNRKRGKPVDFFSLNLPPETRAYVPKLLALKEFISKPAKYNLNMPTIPDEPYFERVAIESQIDLAKAAEMAEIELDELYQLNPGYNRWATDPDGENYLLLPIDKVDIFRNAFTALPKEDRIRWVRHKIKNGETLSTIANKYHTSISSIKKVNHIRGSEIGAGKSLTIPVASKSMSNYRLSANQRKNNVQSLPREGVKVTHIVQQGDTFWDLATLHKVGVRQLAKWNGMAPRDTLVPGQKLVIWSQTGKSVSHNDPGELVIPPKREITKRIGYRVRQGDSLALISQRFRVSVNQLRRWNDLPVGKYLQPGQRLTLFVDVTSQSS
ncbi:MAG: LysM peptidoglycan-binding domain-containing protein [Gammaproteobacteria bacterium]|nr:LysM peptidoglycan-binding domain-containing protein [Gammaproteobacteria bacterium]